MIRFAAQSAIISSFVAILTDRGQDNPGGYNAKVVQMVCYADNSLAGCFFGPPFSLTQHYAFM
jgi:hypothetical protein